MPRKQQGLYAEGTDTPVRASRDEIERTLVKYGAEDIGLMTAGSAGLGIIVFVLHGRRVKMEVAKPGEEDWTAYNASKAKPTQSYWQNYEKVRKTWIDGEERRRWRVLLLRLKARLEVSGHDSAAFEVEFLPYIMLPDNRTVGDTIRPMIAQAYEQKENVLMLPGLAPDDEAEYVPPRK